MIEFLYSLLPFKNPLINNAFIAGILSSVCFGIIGSFVVVKRISAIAGSMAHSSLGGIGFALFLHYNIAILWFTPLIGALISAVVSALIIGLVNLYASQREDTVIGAVWAIGMAIGLIFIFHTKKYKDAMSYLFGDILFISGENLLIIVMLDVIVIAVCLLFYNKFLAVSFDQEFAKLRGVRVEFFYILLLLLTALTIVLMATIVGILLVIALLTLPAAIAGLFSKKLWQMMLISAFLCLVFTVTGLLLSYAYDLPPGAAITLCAGGAYVLVLLLSQAKNKFFKSI
ncbi:MAG: metal ABC transporter permease [Spirochaetales bacterium]|nr:metal ABC transporter permease [Spirochaetales bacterium]